ncbi:MAG: SpoIIE family protein phosphatase [Bdellovibrionales bacterium]|nr:SpoIIE family protein phosphatase [Bdellovibrionales bacterium]
MSTSHSGAQLPQSPPLSAPYDQAAPKLKRSLGTKLLLGLLGLMLAVVLIIDLSALSLIRDDKRTATFQAQAVESAMVGREFASIAKHSIAALRIALTGIEDSKSLFSRDLSQVRKILENQTDLLSLSMASGDLTKGDFEVFVQAAKYSELKRIGYDAPDLLIPDKQIRSVADELQKNGYAFIKLTQGGRAPLLGVVAFAQFKDRAKGKGVLALGHLGLDQLATDLKHSKVTLATLSGRLLFDSNLSRLYEINEIKEDPHFKYAVSGDLLSGAREVKNEIGQDGNPEHLFVSYFRPGLETVVITKAEYKRVMRPLQVMAEKFVLLGILAIGASILFAVYFARGLAGPIKVLDSATREVGKGRFDLKLSTVGDDEIAGLSHAFNVMSAKIKQLIQDVIRKTQLEGEVRLASTVQQNLFPKKTVETENFCLYSDYVSASECGGDWLGHFQHDGKLAIMIADATGHGIPAALITAAARSCFSVITKMVEDTPDFRLSPGKLLTYANRAVHESGGGQINMTFFIGVYDFKTGFLRYASAAHNPPWLFKKAEGMKMSSLTANGPRLGETMEVKPYEEKSVRLEKGDIVLFYTDGILEGTDRGGEQYGKKNMKKTFESRLNLGAQNAVRGLFQDFMTYNGDKPLDDDVSLCALEVIREGEVPTEL